MKDLMYNIHQELEVVDLGIEEPNIQLLFEILQDNLIHYERKIFIAFN